ncbi:hypothetical protein [Streptomyces erythrochromogenes]|uniref:hypothetical protein n=1 Tax=Streptomyces erythrochromogenes TaxID=285574 RepID=UPI0033D9B920
MVGEDEMYAMLDDLGVLRAAAARISTLRRAVREFLGHYADARSGPFAIYPRRPEHAALRLSIGWHQAGGPLRSSAGYTGGDRIARPAGYLAALLTTHECDHPNCEAGVFLDTREECNTCQYRAAERIAQAKAVQLLAEQQVRAAAVAELRARQLADEREHAHGEALEEDASLEEAAARRRARAAAAAEETARLRAELAEQFAALDAAAARPVVPAPLRPDHDEDPVEADAFPDEEDPFAPNHFEDEGSVPDLPAGASDESAARGRWRARTLWTRLRRPR